MSGKNLSSKDFFGPQSDMNFGQKEPKRAIQQSNRYLWSKNFHFKSVAKICSTGPEYWTASLPQIYGQFFSTSTRIHVVTVCILKVLHE